jgi:hypothetical protein
LLWHSFHNRNLADSVQGLFHRERHFMAGRSVFRDDWNRADRFVVSALIGAQPQIAADLQAFLDASRPGDYLVASLTIPHPQLLVMGSAAQHRLYRRID